MVMRGLWGFRSDVKASGFVDMVRTDDVDGSRGLSGLVSRAGKWPTFSQALHGRAQQAGAPTKANAKAKANENADPSPLKGVRDDSHAAFFRGL